MRFSILLPTRNRLELLACAIETVHRQDFHDWEIVVSDNCSEEDIASYVQGLSDERIRYQRTERFLPVTENWSRALEASRGDYVIMLGDDDGLLRGYLSTLDRLIREHG
jgi:glycosyltransferase involved in cell wall biosynthesis